MPKIRGMKLAEPLPVSAIHHYCVISQTTDKWFVVIKYEIQKPSVEVDRPTVGVDIGIK